MELKAKLAERHTDLLSFEKTVNVEDGYKNTSPPVRQGAVVTHFFYCLMKRSTFPPPGQSPESLRRIRFAG